MDEDYALIEQIRDGDETALVRLMEQYKEPVYRLAWRFTGNGTDAEALTEETFARVYFKAHTYRPKSSVRSWMYRIAANLCRDHLRRRSKHRGLVSLFAPRNSGPSAPEADSIAPEASLAASDADAAETLVANERVEEIENAIQSLPEKLRFPFIFCVLEEHSHEEAAEVIGTSRKTIESRIYRARKILQTILTSS